METSTLMALTGMPDHHGSHLALLRKFQGDLPLGNIDAIVVPTIRHPKHLLTAKDLVAELGCTLVTVHSGKWTSASMATPFLAGVRSIAIDVPDVANLRLADLETTRLTVGARLARRKDTSAKRNLALSLAHMANWRRIVFLDDDISVGSADDPRKAAGLLDEYNAVGMAIGGYEDNSAVCHAYRLVGGEQKSFVGGGALAVETTRSRGFFPDIYNEDWFYLLDPKEGLQPLAVTGAVNQAPYDPFREERARNEEFGDVLAEGIFWLLDQGRALNEADRAHWQEFLEHRRNFIRHIINRLDSAPMGQALRGQVRSTLRAALGRSERIRPELCEKYVNAWRADRRSWSEHIDGLKQGVEPEEALELLSADGSRPLSYVSRQARVPRARNRKPTGGDSTTFSLKWQFEADLVGTRSAQYLGAKS
jgi:hypothetical protein